MAIIDRHWINVNLVFRVRLRLQVSGQGAETPAVRVQLQRRIGTGAWQTLSDQEWGTINGAPGTGNPIVTQDIIGDAFWKAAWDRSVAYRVRIRSQHSGTWGSWSDIYSIRI
jgi:hypothetical protein